VNASGLLPAPQGGFDVLGTWWHFDRYEICGGALRPAADAALVTYDPWARYEEARSGWGSSGGKAPYEVLLDLVWRLRLRPTSNKDEPTQLEPESRQALLSWCAEYGLLGLLPHEAEVAYLAPRWGPVAEFELAGIPLVETRLLYQWGPNGWQAGMDAWWKTMTPALNKASKKDGELVPPELVPDELWGPPSVLCRAIDDASWATLPIERAWGPFFPDVDEKDRRGHFYPPPLSDVFWTSYGEPLSAFLEAATLFSETLQNLDAEARDDSPPHALDVEHRRRLANRNFFSLLSGCHPALARDDRGGRTRAFHSKSLLASLAMMAYLDLTSGKRVLLCDEDGRPFVSGAYQARYCSDRCRNRALKRAYRERHRGDNIQRTSA
jgi:hypothetical protein